MKSSRFLLALSLALGAITQDISLVVAMSPEQDQSSIGERKRTRDGDDGGPSEPPAKKVAREQKNCLICNSGIAAEATLPRSTCGHEIPVHQNCLDTHPQDLACPTCGHHIPETCIICFGKFVKKSGQRATALALCPHNLNFHKKCLETWLHQSDHCPVCNAAAPAEVAPALPITPNAQLLWAAERGDIPGINAALAAGANILARTDWGHCTALHLAAFHGHAAAINVLLHVPGLLHNQVMSLLNAQTRDHETALHFSTQRGDFNSVNFLLHTPDLTHDELMDLLLAQTNQGHTALHNAYLSDNNNVINALLHAPGITHDELITLLNARTNDGCTTLHKAATCWRTDAINTLFNSMGLTHNELVSLLNIRNNAGHTALHIAVICGFINGSYVVATLLDAAKFTHSEIVMLVNTQAHNGDTPLHLAAYDGNCPVVNKLLDAGANPTITNQAGKTPATIAREHHHNNVVCIIEPNPLTNPILYAAKIHRLLAN